MPLSVAVDDVSNVAAVVVVVGGGGAAGVVNVLRDPNDVPDAFCAMAL